MPSFASLAAGDNNNTRLPQTPTLCQTATELLSELPHCLFTIGALSDMKYYIKTQYLLLIGTTTTTTTTTTTNTNYNNNYKNKNYNNCNNKDQGYYWLRYSCGLGCNSYSSD